MRLLILMLCAAQAWATVYYVKPYASGGRDTYTGLSDDQAWATVGKVNSVSLSPGDQVLFKRGGVWEESLSPTNSGSVGNPIIFGAYGTGAKPEITQLLDVSGAMDEGNWEYKAANIYEFADAVSNNYRVILGGHAYGHANEFTGINSRFRWFIDSGVLRVYSPSGKPSSYYSSIKMNSGRAVDLDGVDYLTFRGLKISGGMQSVLAVSSDYITFDSCNIGNYADKPAMILGIWDGGGLCNNWTMTADTIDRIDTVKYSFYPSSQTGFGDYNGWGDGIQVYDGNSGTIQYCVFKDLRHASINLDGEWYSGAETSNWLIEHNEFTSKSDYNRPIDVHSYQRNTVGTIFRYNYIHNMTVWESFCEISGNNGQYYYNILDSLYTSSWVTDAQRTTRAFKMLGNGDRWCRNNLIANNTVMHTDGSAFDFSEYDQNRQQLDTLKVYNNIFYKNGNDATSYTVEGWRTSAFMYGLEIFQQQTPADFYMDFRNNYLYNTLVSDAAIIKDVDYTDRWTVADYNTSDTENEVISGNAWSNTAVGADHKIGSGSSARNAGIDWGHTGTDYFGNAIVGNPDVGAHEYTAAGSPTITTGCPLPSGSDGYYYSLAIGSTGGTPPYAYDISAGSLPDSVSLSAAGIISGTPVTPGVYTFTIRVTDDAVATDTKSCQLTIAASPPPVGGEGRYLGWYR